MSYQWLFRGFYEFGEYGFRASYANAEGLDWSEFDEDNNHMRYVLLVLLFEWPVFLVLAWYFEQVSANREIIGRTVNVSRLSKDLE